jgi:hexosaminidase
VDNSQPNQYHPLYKEPIVYPEGADIFRVITYKGGKPAGKMITIKTDDLAKRVKK